MIPNISYWMHREGSESYNDLIKIFILLLCTTIRQDKEIANIYMYVTMQPIQPIKLQFPLFLANVNVLTNKLVQFYFCSVVIIFLYQNFTFLVFLISILLLHHKK